jgi:hypothetical protein
VYVSSLQRASVNCSTQSRAPGLSPDTNPPPTRRSLRADFHATPPTRPRRSRDSPMAPAAIDLDVPKIEAPILRFQEFRTLADQPGFFGGLSNEPTNHPKPNKTLYMYIYTPYSRILSYLYPIPILPLYTLVGWTDSQNKLKESELACPPTRKPRWTLGGQIATRWTGFFYSVHPNVHRRTIRGQTLDKI